MALMLDEEMDENVTTIKVIGVGGGGGNAVNRMVSDGLQGVDFIAMNTDQQALAKNHAAVKVQLGSKLTKGRGAGADPEIGQRAAEESKDEIANALKGSQMVFITAGMGGGTGTGAAPVVAEVAHDLGILTVGIVTKPFSFEGKRKMGLAEQGIANLLMHVDSLIVIPNERLKLISQEKITLMNAVQAADNVLRQGVESISALINVPAFINLDFADVRSIMKDAGYAHMGVGSAKGAGKAENAAKAAISSPLLETSIAGAQAAKSCWTGWSTRRISFPLPHPPGSTGRARGACACTASTCTTPFTTAFLRRAKARRAMPSVPCSTTCARRTTTSPAPGT